MAWRIENIHIENFKIDLKGLIKKGYLLDNNMNRDRYILFDYKDGSITRCETYDITDFIQEE